MNPTSLHNIMNIFEYYESQGLTEFKKGEMRVWFNTIKMHHNIKNCIEENIMRIWREKKASMIKLIRYIQVLILITHIKINKLKTENGKFKYIEETEVIMSSNIITQIMIDPLIIMDNYSDIKYNNKYDGIVIELEY
jgi:hypothetical protein